MDRSPAKRSVWLYGRLAQLVERLLYTDGGVRNRGVRRGKNPHGRAKSKSPRYPGLDANPTAPFGDCSERRTFERGFWQGWISG